MSEPRTGHYALGIRDGGSEWHVGTREWRECKQGCREEVEYPEKRAAEARADVLRAVRERVEQWRSGVAFSGVLPRAIQIDALAAILDDLEAEGRGG